MLPQSFSLWSVFAVLLLACVGRAQKTVISSDAAEHCTGIYSKRDWGGPGESFIKVDLQQFKDKNPATGEAFISLIIFEYQDLDGLGVYDESLGRRRYICTDSMVSSGLCSSDQVNQFIVDENFTSYAQIKTTVLTSLGTNDFSYTVSNTGYYCVAAYSPDFTSNENTFKVLLNFHNAFGSLPASQIPLLPLYGLLAVIYAVCLGVYLFQVFKHRSELLLLQKYLAGFFVFLAAENILTWSLYDLENNSKSYPMPGGIRFYIVVISFLNAFKVSFSLFLLLIISLGYGVVFPKLPRKQMNLCKILSVVHFLFLGAFTCLNYYSSESQPGQSATDTSYSVDTYQSNSWLILSIAFPLAILFVVFYFMILNSMQKTVKMLKEQKQIVKLNMYKKLFRLIFVSLLLMIFAFVISTIILFNDNVAQSIEKLWKFDDVLTNFWPACLYFLIFVGIVIIWRPTDSSYLLAVSSQIPSSEAAAGDQETPNADVFNNSEQFGNEFEFDDLRSLESDAADANPFQDPSSDTVGYHTSTSKSEVTPEGNPFEDPRSVDYDLELEQQKMKESNSDGKFQLDDEEDDGLAGVGGPEEQVVSPESAEHAGPKDKSD
ncbi:DEKNAAC101819 [Brettanomyces naardenensis]|uniref:DEKNAAC101819 n=1 Tax=Brettanomyces naardenensis TaxID=13370 RepID=A0A448YIV7_BRENA|nr:DEKNAAC101819 [Brettanomyces naardenensis]